MSEPLPKKYTYDFGQNIAGIVSVRMKGKRGVRVMIRHGEMLNTDVAYQMPGEKSVKGGDGPPRTIYRKNLRSARATDYYTFKRDDTIEEYTPRFTFHGFRYVEISGIDTYPESVTGIAFSSDNIQTSSFESSNVKVNKLYSNVYWGMRGNFVSIPTYCPNGDERLGWGGDTQVFSGTGIFLSNSDQFYSKWLLDLRSFQMNEEKSNRDKGLVPTVIPSVHSIKLLFFCNFWGDAAVIVPWKLYQQFGDTRIISEAYESMKAWCNFLNNQRRSQNFIRLNGVRQDMNYGDLLALQPSTIELINTISTAYSNKLLSKIARIIGKQQDADMYQNLTNYILNAFRKTFKTANGSLKSTTQTAYALMLYYDLAEESEKPIYLGKLLENIRSNGWKLTTGFIGAECLCPSLSQNGAAEVAFKLLEQEEYPSWIYSINQGATTTWERWNGFTVDNGFVSSGTGSFNRYSFGSVVEWLFSGILGIRREEQYAGFRRFILDPQYGGTLTHAKGYFDSMVGRISSSWTWDHNSNVFIYNCSIPPNSRATIYIPANEAKKVIEGGIPAYEAKGIEYIGFNYKTKREVFTAWSGNYSFSSVASPVDKLE
jgi:alpha-L-rhamnosidase